VGAVGLLDTTNTASATARTLEDWDTASQVIPAAPAPGDLPMERGRKGATDSWKAVVRAYIAAKERRACATCPRTIRRGERFRKDTWRGRIFGRVLSSAICSHCEAVGL